MEIAALILAGGKSSRMGYDKRLIQWSDDFTMIDILKRHCESLGIAAYISVAQSAVGIKDDTQYIIDDYNNIGPIGGIYSAMTKHKEKAWLVMACDMPLIDTALMENLLVHRDPTKIATIYYSNRVEPLFGIWEYSSAILLQQSILDGKYSLMKILAAAQNQVKYINSDDIECFVNINTPQERMAFEEKYSK